MVAACGVVLANPAAANAKTVSGTDRGLAVSDVGAWVVPAKSADEETIFLALRPAHVTASGQDSRRAVVDVFQVFPITHRHPNEFSQLTGHVAFNSSGFATFPFDSRQNGRGDCLVQLGVNRITVTVDRTVRGSRGPSVFSGQESFRRSNSGQSFIGIHPALEQSVNTKGPIHPFSSYAGDWVWQSEQYRPRILGGLDMTLSFAHDSARLSLWQISPFAGQIAHFGTNITFSSSGTARFSYNDSAWGDHGVGIVQLDGGHIVLTLTRTHGGSAPYGIFPGRYVFV